MTGKTDIAVVAAGDERRLEFGLLASKVAAGDCRTSEGSAIGEPQLVVDRRQQ